MTSGRLRVVILAESYLPYVSGVTVSTDALARGLGRLGHDVMVVAPRPAAGARLEAVGSPGPPPRHAWLPAYQLPVLAPAGYRMPWPTPIARALRAAISYAPDIVHTQSPFVVGLMARHVARRAAAPLVFTHHTRFADYGHYAGPAAAAVSRAANAYLRRFWDGCAGIVAPSRDLAAEIEARLPPARSRPVVRAIPTGVDTQLIASLAAIDPRPMAGWSPDSVVIATLGRLAPEKSVELVLEAAAVAFTRDPRGRLLVIGGGPSAERLHARAAEADLDGRVHFADARPRLEALGLLRGCDAFAYASATETQGLVLAEAIACGLPVAALDGPGLGDTVRDGIDGTIVPRSEGARRLGEELGRLIGDDGRRAAEAAAAVGGAARLDVAARVGEVTGLYRDLLGTRR